MVGETFWTSIWAYYLYGLIGIVLLNLAVWLGCRTQGMPFSLLEFAVGATGKMSISKFQMFLWTYVVLWSLLVVALRTLSWPSIHQSLVILMGISYVSFVGAKWIAVSNLPPERRAVPPEVYRQNRARTGFHDLFRYRGRWDISKFQMFAWTLVTLFIYLYQFHRSLGVHLQAGGVETFVLPAVPDQMLALMGVSQGGYLGNKLVEGALVGVKGLETAPEGEDTTAGAGSS